MSRKPNDRQTPKHAGPLDQPDTEEEERQAEAEEESRGAGFPVVGIGASAGGLGAFEAFFSGLPADTDPGMAFVLVQHLAPDHTSILAELVRRYSPLRVFEVTDGMPVEPDCIYIIPPNRDLALVGGVLRLVEQAAPRGQRLPVDHFFRSLARDQRERAICVVLSGSGSDGTQGVRAVKGEGGMVMAQAPDTTEYDGMARSAIATGLVDYVLPPARMGAQLLAYVAHAFGHPPVPAAGREPEGENALKRILVLLRTHTGHDFAKYKMNTIQRRIERRMAVHQIASREEYAAYLRQAPVEIDALFHDLLIGVTSFFRDPAEFRVLEERVIPRLFAGKVPGGTSGSGARAAPPARRPIPSPSCSRSAWTACASRTGCRCSPPTSIPRPSPWPGPASTRPASPRTCPPSAWGGSSPPSRTPASCASTRASGT